jgi:hypothetical protein
MNPHDLSGAGEFDPNQPRITLKVDDGALSKPLITSEWDPDDLRGAGDDFVVAKVRPR